MKTVAPSLCFLAGAGLASSFLVPSIPVAPRSNASPRRASQRDTVVASGEHFEVRVGKESVACTSQLRKVALVDGFSSCR